MGFWKHLRGLGRGPDSSASSLPTYEELDRAFVPEDQKRLLRTRNLRLVPSVDDRRGGRQAYGEWCHIIGIFQTLLLTHIDSSTPRHVLDVGCGSGLLAIASEPLVQNGGRYIGIDVIPGEIDFCRTHYQEDHLKFRHVPANNPHYAPGQGERRTPWDLGSGSIDVVTALSVWTHLNEDDAIFYFREVDRVLAPGGKAILTFFYLDESYERSLAGRSNAISRYHGTPSNHWIYDQPSCPSGDWRHPAWADVPEQAIGVTPNGLDRCKEGTQLELIATHEGNWKERPGVYFQDILIFEKRA